MSTISARSTTLTAAICASGFVVYNFITKAFSSNKKEQYQIRNINPSKDCDSLKIVLKETFPDGEEDMWDDSSTYKKFLNEFITRKYSFVAVTKSKDNKETVVGFCLITLQADNYEYKEEWETIESIFDSTDDIDIEIALIGVTAHFQRKGIGYKLVTSCVNALKTDVNIETMVNSEDDSKTSNMKEFCMDLHVRESNIAALKLYKKIGFGVCGPKIEAFYDHPEEDAIPMKLIL